MTSAFSLSTHHSPHSLSNSILEVNQPFLLGYWDELEFDMIGLKTPHKLNLYIKTQASGSKSYTFTESEYDDILNSIPDEIKSKIDYRYPVDPELYL